MTDLEITRACAEAMGYEEYKPNPHWTDEDRKEFHINDGGLPMAYHPLTNDAEAMSLVKKFRLRLLPQFNGTWVADEGDQSMAVPYIYGRGDTPNRAICQCVARMPK